MINKRKILLTPEIGDWTQFLPEDSSKEIKIVNVGVSKFDRLSRGELVEAHKLHYLGYEAYAKYLTDTLKIKCDLYSLEIVQTAYSNTHTVLGEGYFQVSILIENRFSLNLYLQNTIANTLIDRALGGKGEASQDPMSKIEQKVLEKVVEQLMTPFFNYWNVDMSSMKITEVVGATSEDLTLNPQSAYLLLLGKIALGANQPGMVALGYGRETIEELLKRYRSRLQQFRNRNVDLADKTQKKIRMPFKVEIGSTDLTMKDLMTLTEGDVIKMDTPINSFIKGTLADTITFMCFPGTKDNNLAVKVFGLQSSIDFEDNRQLSSGIVLLPANQNKISSVEDVTATPADEITDSSAEIPVEPDVRVPEFTLKEQDVTVVADQIVPAPFDSDDTLKPDEDDLSWDIIEDETKLENI